MSRQFRYRVTAIVLGGLIFGAPMLANGTASAEQLGESDRQVTFAGGSIMGLNCRSTPEVESMVVPADSTIRVVNRTGYSARLLLGGESKGTLADDSSTDVIFRRGTTAVTLKPNCPLGDDVDPLMVTASPSAAAMPDPTPAPSTGTSDAIAVAPSDSGEPSGSLMPDSASPGRPGVVRSDSQRPGLLRNSSGMASMPLGNAAARTKVKDKVKVLPRTAGVGPAPAFAGMPPGEKKTLVPGVPQLDVAPLSPAAAPPVVAAAPPVTSEIAAAEPVARMEPMREGGRLGVLGLIASICVLGVGAAAIRSIVSQRANRSKLA